MGSGDAVLCLITARRRLAAAVGRPDLPDDACRALVVEQVRGAVAGGVDVVQIREPDLPAAALAALVRACLEVARGTPARVIVNDRLDVARATDAHGVHLREDSLPLAAVRRLADAPFLVGRSVHDAAGAHAARAADYLIAGHVFATASKAATAAALGIEGLAGVVAAAAGCPVWAVGGVDAGRVGAVRAAGAAGVAAIGAFLPGVGAGDVAGSVHELAIRLRFAFDSPRTLS